MDSERVVYTIAEFCKAHGISKSGFYLLEKKNLTPRMMHVGTKRRLISVEAAEEWRKAMEQKRT